MKKWFAAGLISAGIILLTLGFSLWQAGGEIVSPLASSFLKKSLPGVNKYAPYTFEALSARELPPGKISLASLTKEEKNFDTYVFTYQSDGKIISGMANLPRGEGPFPVIVLLRGYADQETYHIGLGTERSANFLAERGFLTLAPDFLGYGWSDWEDQDILLARFYRPVEVLNLLSAIDSLPQADSSQIGLWGHSNGGQIALSILEITGKPYPTSLWAPVSLGFPESVTVYLGVEEEVGNPVKEKLAEFLKDNNPKDFSIAEYWAKIKSPFIIHQGLSDELIKTEWTRDLVDQLKSQNLSVEAYYYRGENHNFNRYKSTGDLLRQRDLSFFRRYLGK